MGVIYEHHEILKSLNNSGKPLRDKIYDYVINLSDQSENEANKSSNRYNKVNDASFITINTIRDIS